MSISAFDLGGGVNFTDSKGSGGFMAEPLLYEKKRFSARRGRKSAFTLAEVLITLGIIGVVAAMTLPALIQNYQKQVMLSQLKKNYAILTQAVSMLKAEYDNVNPNQMPFVTSYWGHNKVFGTAAFVEVFNKYLPSSWDGVVQGGNHCFQDLDKWNVKALGGYNLGKSYYSDGNTHSWILNNGACITLRQDAGWEWNDDTAVKFIIDVNGSDRNPNQYGKDIYEFLWYGDGRLLPNKHNLTADQIRSDWNGCMTTSRGSGEGCATLIMQNGWSFPKDYPWK